VGCRQSLSHGRPDRTDKLLVLGLELLDEGSKLGLRCDLRTNRTDCHTILQVLVRSADYFFDLARAGFRLAGLAFALALALALALAFGFCLRSTSLRTRPSRSRISSVIRWSKSS